ncbi:MAG TPA: helix-turn-helix domain-containing protein [Candidatus Limnocylindria bacterium]|nr:helix-turn-helix domain-containing protein [Candidatus Limnocylindria bacterium]
MSIDADRIAQTVERLEVVAEEPGLDGATDAQAAAADPGPALSKLPSVPGLSPESPLWPLLQRPARPKPPSEIELVGRYVRRARGFAGVSQRTLAANAGVSQSMLARLETGHGGGVRIDRLVAIGATLGRALPLGFCPHRHGCAWERIEPPAPLTRSEEIREALIQLGIDSPYDGWRGDD